MPLVDDAKLAETMAKYYPCLVCKYYLDYPSYTPPPTSKPLRLKESMVALADTMAKIKLASKRLAASTVNLVPISTNTTTLISTITRSEINKPDNTMVKLLTDTPSITKIETEVVTHIPLSMWSDLLAKTIHKTTRLRHDIAIFHQTTIHETYGVATFIDDKLALCLSRDLVRYQHKVDKALVHHKVDKDLFGDDRKVMTWRIKERNPSEEEMRRFGPIAKITKKMEWIKRCEQNEFSKWLQFYRSKLQKARLPKDLPFSKEIWLAQGLPFQRVLLE
ncbi:hypothetical protein Tco_0699070 [Tanacetum coccineum]